ncbi:MAG: carboxypeptidase-like regulatory domain-containing protein, partial [Parafilimonas sp.]
MNVQTKNFAKQCKTIFLVTLTAFAFLFFNQAKANSNHLPERIISGNVTDSASGQPLTLVSVTIKGKKVATTTNQQGMYSISADDNDVLIFSYVGYKNQSVNVGSETTIDVVMKPAEGTLHDVVVTALGITKQKRSVGYSVSEVKGSTLTEVRTNSFV